MEGLLRVGSVPSVVVLLVQLLLSLLHVDHELLLILQVPDVSMLLRVRDVALYATGLMDSLGHAAFPVLIVQLV